MAGIFVAPRGSRFAVFWADGPLRRAVFVRVARFHFDKDEGLALPANEVDFARTRRHAIVARNYDQACTLEKPMRQNPRRARPWPDPGWLFSNDSAGAGDQSIGKASEAWCYSYQCRTARFFLLLDDFEFELHHFAANHEAEVVLPKLSKSREIVHQQFEPEISP